MVNFSFVCEKDDYHYPYRHWLNMRRKKKKSSCPPSFSLFALWSGDFDPHAYDAVRLTLSPLSPPFSLSFLCGRAILIHMLMTHTWPSPSLSLPLVGWFSTCLSLLNIIVFIQGKSINTFSLYKTHHCFHTRQKTLYMIYKYT